VVVMLREAIQSESLFALLHKIDVDLAESARAGGCPYCEGPLHYASYQRQPRGGPKNLPEEYLTRLSLCCGDEKCRRRTLPLSVLFWGRRVYWGAVIIVVTALRQQRSEGYCADKICTMFGVPILTLKRWLTYFREIFPLSEIWQRLRSMLMPPVAPESIPLAVLERLGLARDDPGGTLIQCLRMLRLGVG
jgi:hypothetical protein